MKKVLTTLAAVVLIVIIILIVVADFIMPKSKNPPLGTPTTPIVATTSLATSTATTTPKKVVAGSGNTVSYVSTITRTANNKVVYVKKGSRFTLALGDLEWTVTIGDTATIGQIQNFTVVKGVQGTYTGIKPGMTTIRAEGKPHCDSGKSCLGTVTNFKVTVVVK